MFGLFILLIIGGVVLFHRQTITEVASESTLKFADKLDKLWQIAQESLKDQKYLRAEKALLTILRVDERNATAYNRLGILYAKQQAYDDAISCFEIAQSLELSASSLHNVGLIYLETKKYTKAELAFKQAIELGPEVASRHIAYAKVQEKLGRHKKMLESLEYALTLEKTPQVLRILADAYETAGQPEKAEHLREEVEAMLAPRPTKVVASAAAPQKKVQLTKKRSRKVM